MDDNISLQIEELQTPTMVELFEEVIPKDAMTIAVKINFPDEEIDRPYYFLDIFNYLKDSGFKILASSGGIHLQGLNNVPHIHYHFLTEPYTGSALVNNSQHRKRYFMKNKIEITHDISFKFKQITKEPKWQFLSYPLKEKKYFNSNKYKSIYTFDTKPMDQQLFNFLLETGATLFDKALAIRERVDKTNERKQLALSQLYDLCKSQTFSSYREMRLWLEDNYIQKLPLNELPDLKNYNNNCMKVGVILKLYKYCDN